MENIIELPANFGLYALIGVFGLLTLFIFGLLAYEIVQDKKS